MNKLYIILLGFIFIFNSKISAQEAEVEAAKNHLKTKAQNFKLSENDFSNMKVSDVYLDSSSGVYHIYFKQTFRDIEVYNGIINIGLKNGFLINANSRFVPNIELQIANNNLFSGVSAKEALVKALNSVNLKTTENLKSKQTKSNIFGINSEELFVDKEISDEDIRVKLYWYSHFEKVGEKNIEKIDLVWSVQALTKSHQNAWSIRVNAQSGKIIDTFDDVIHCDFGERQSLNAQPSDHHHLDETKGTSAANSYTVFDYPIESPNHGSRTTVVNPYTKFAAAGTGPGTTNGWHDNGTSTFTDTRGNNVYAQDDVDANDTGGDRPNPANYSFDYPYQLGLSTAATNRNASITNLFYWNNLVHDVLWNMGFNEAAGNFQTNNLSRGGLGNDAIYADAQDGSGSSNADFYTPADGSAPRMQMYLWDDPSTYQADSDFDNAVISHEYGHGWSIRLTGGPSNSSCLSNTEQGGEGWSDYLALMLTTNWGSLSPNVTSANIPRGIGTYVLGESTSGAGIRPYRYSYDMSNINGAVTYSKVGDYNFSQPHGIGSIWCTMLWDMTWEIIMEDQTIVSDIYNTGNMVGNVAALKLVSEGLKLQPCSPSFVDARDAILNADQAFFGGKYQCAIGRAFSRRGLGLNASTGSSSDDRLVVEDFTNLSGNSLSGSKLLSVCSGNEFSYSAQSTLAGTAFSWTRSIKTGISNQPASGNTGVINETLINTTTNPITVEYVFQLTPSGCGQSGSVTSTLRVSVLPNPVVPEVSQYSICQTATVPVGGGLKMPTGSSLNTVSNSLNIGDSIFDRNGGTQVYYKTFSITPTSNVYNKFEITTASFDTYIYLYQGSFNPLSPNTNLIALDDDSGADLFSLLYYNLNAGQTYTLVVTSFSYLTSGTFTLNSSNVTFTDNYAWYTEATGGTPIFYGKLFNPVGVSGSGILNTNIPIVKSYYVNKIGSNVCRSTTNFTVSQAPNSLNPNVSVSSSDTLCAIFNSGTLTHTGTQTGQIGWEISENNFQTYQFVNSISPSISFAGLNNSTMYRAVFIEGTCLLSKSLAAKITITKPMLELSDTSRIYWPLQRAGLHIQSNQKVISNTNSSYQAGRSINLNEGFEAKSGSIFEANIIQNICPIPVVLTLQPDSSNSKDGDVSSLFPSVAYFSNRYMVPFNWNQFGSEEKRRSYLEFDISSIPADAIIDSAFLDLSFSQQLISDNPQYSGHFGNNVLEVKRITSSWAVNSISWNTQPSTTETNMLEIAQADSQMRNYIKLNVKTLIADMFTNGNYGFLIKHKVESPYKLTSIASSEDKEQSKRPKLTIYFHYF